MDTLGGAGGGTVVAGGVAVSMSIASSGTDASSGTGWAVAVSSLFTAVTPAGLGVAGNLTFALLDLLTVEPPLDVGLDVGGVCRR